MLLVAVIRRAEPRGLRFDVNTVVVRQLAAREGGRRRGAGRDGGDGGRSGYDRRGWDGTAVQVHAGAGGFICGYNMNIFFKGG